MSTNNLPHVYLLIDVAANINEIDPSATDLKTKDLLPVEESRILQERTIGVFGAVSLVVNKIVGAGYFPCILESLLSIS